MVIHVSQHPGNGWLATPVPPKSHEDGGKHYALWEDAFKKPSYLFALVVGQLESRDDTFVTRSSRQVALRIWTPFQDVPRMVHAMYTLKAAMKWDEEFQVFGLEYDLNLFNIVAVPDFNMGAMENKNQNESSLRQIPVMIVSSENVPTSSC